MVVAKLRVARERKKAETGRCGGRPAVPEVVLNRVRELRKGGLSQRFSAGPELATGVVAGRIDEFYRGTRILEAGTRLEFSGPAAVAATRSETVRSCVLLAHVSATTVGGRGPFHTGGRPFSNSTLIAKS